MKKRSFRVPSSQFHNQQGFTLVEVMLVVVILGILAAVGAVALKGRSQQASVAATRATISAVESALDLFEVDHGAYPNSLQELMASTGNPQWHGPYFKGKSVPADAWGNAINYSKGSDGYSLTSYGPDGTSSSDDLTN